MDSLDYDGEVSRLSDFEVKTLGAHISSALWSHQLRNVAYLLVVQLMVRRAKYMRLHWVEYIK
jgi:hypothetical protein